MAESPKTGLRHHLRTIERETWINILTGSVIYSATFALVVCYLGQGVTVDWMAVIGVSSLVAAVFTVVCMMFLPCRLTCAILGPRACMGLGLILQYVFFSWLVINREFNHLLTSFEIYNNFNSTEESSKQTVLYSVIQGIQLYIGTCHWFFLAPVLLLYIASFIWGFSQMQKIEKAIKLEEARKQERKAMENQPPQGPMDRSFLHSPFQPHASSYPITTQSAPEIPAELRKSSAVVCAQHARNWGLGGLFVFTMTMICADKLLDLVIISKNLRPLEEIPSDVGFVVGYLIYSCVTFALVPISKQMKHCCKMIVKQVVESKLKSEKDMEAKMESKAAEGTAQPSAPNPSTPNQAAGPASPAHSPYFSRAWSPPLAPSRSNTDFLRAFSPPLAFARNQSEQTTRF